MGKYKINHLGTVSGLLEKVDIPYEVCGNTDIEVHGVASIFDGEKGYLSYCLYTEDIKVDVIKKCASSVLLLHSDIKEKLVVNLLKDKTYVFSKNPKLVYIQMLSEAANRIGENTVIETGALVDDACQIGANVYINSCAEIGSGAVIESGSVIGVRGASFAVDDTGNMYQMPQYGRVVLEDRVWIGANTVVVRGIFEDTVIKSGSIIGNLCNIGHEVKIGRNTFISAGVVIAGGVEIGDNCWIGPGSRILQKIKIGSGSKVAIGSLVVKDVAPDMFVGGNPARVISTAGTKGSMVR